MFYEAAFHGFGIIPSYSCCHISVIFTGIFPLNGLTLFVHLTLVYGVVEIKNIYISLFFLVICILSWLPSPEARGKKGEGKWKKKIVSQMLEEGIRQRHNMRGWWKAVEWRPAGQVKQNQEEAGRGLQLWITISWHGPRSMLNNYAPPHPYKHAYIIKLGPHYTL